MKHINEEILDAWLQLSMTISNEKIVSEMPYNESLICSVLHRNALEHPERKMTATELCEKTNMWKSQMNRSLNSLEKKGLIFRKRSEEDRRQVFVSMNMDNAEIYEKQHERILHFIDSVMEKVGNEKADQIIQLFTLITKKAKEVMDS